MLEKAIEEFNKYTDNFDKTDKNIALKCNHSFAVMDLMGELAFRLNLDKEKIELARLIGLLHDIGRFTQLEKFKSYDDNLLDHAVVGTDYLFKDGNIRKFIRDDKYDNLIETAIRCHNKFIIPDTLKGDELLFTKMIRDMDKVDIFKQEAINFERYFNASEVTEKVLIEFKEEKAINSAITHTDTDYTLLILGFIFDINFNESFDILVDTDNFDLYLSMINVDEHSENLWKKIKETCFDKINRGIGD